MVGGRKSRESREIFIARINFCDILHATFSSFKVVERLSLPEFALTES